MDILFLNKRPLTSLAVARILGENRFSEKQVSTLLEALYTKGKSAQPATQPATTISVNATIEPSVLTYIQLLLEASKILDEKKDLTNRRWSGRVHSALQSQIGEWNTRRSRIQA